LTLRPYNFSAGPAVLPQSVLVQAAAEMLDWHGSGMGVMEMSHRGQEFIAIHEDAQARLRRLLAVPANYQILFMQGGALAENAILPMNLMGRLDPTNPRADYVNTGSWSVKSIAEASRYGDVHVVASSEHARDDRARFTYIPPTSEWQIRRDTAYLHLCGNETIDGVEFFDWPSVQGDVPLVVDASSHILSRPLDVSQFGVLYGGAQKNIGPAGLTIVIVREDLLGHAMPACPTAFDYQVVAANGSMFNTPPTWAIYIAGLVFAWIEDQGGLAEIERCNVAKARLLYDALDGSDFYANRVDPACRSRMNVPFFLAEDALNPAFLAGARDAGLLQLKGHKSVGGMRASLYNAMPIDGVMALVQYMREFERRHG
jgi:phosphoserine aminotransferase